MSLLTSGVCWQALMFSGCQKQSLPLSSHDHLPSVCVSSYGVVCVFFLSLCLSPFHRSYCRYLESGVNLFESEVDTIQPTSSRIYIYDSLIFSLLFLPCLVPSLLGKASSNFKMLNSYIHSLHRCPYPS